ncbi:hypothetical protein [Streptomyces sp. NPDC047928]|uniref:hypothetical protein n=1 Tax=unclassified Streptomyces TaxID=2593676 RepID=UPI003716E3F0
MSGTGKAAFALACVLSVAAVILAVITTVSWGLADSSGYVLAAAAFVFAALGIRHGAKRG